ncbi:hypothetical protein J2W42_004394 [Rhizobium tibeticum]|nr:hypothetical protein [Rhizobium tibeticum]
MPRVRQAEHACQHDLLSQASQARMLANASSDTDRRKCVPTNRTPVIRCRKLNCPNCEQAIKDLASSPRSDRKSSAVWVLFRKKRQLNLAAPRIARWLSRISAGGRLQKNASRPSTDWQRVAFAGCQTRRRRRDTPSMCPWMRLLRVGRDHGRSCHWRGTVSARFGFQLIRALADQIVRHLRTIGIRSGFSDPPPCRMRRCSQL